MTVTAVRHWPQLWSLSGALDEGHKQWPQKGAELCEGQDLDAGSASPMDRTPPDRLTSLSVSLTCGGKTFKKLVESRGEKRFILGLNDRTFFFKLPFGG